MITRHPVCPRHTPSYDLEIYPRFVAIGPAMGSNSSKTCDRNFVCLKNVSQNASKLCPVSHRSDRNSMHGADVCHARPVAQIFFAVYVNKGVGCLCSPTLRKDWDYKSKRSSLCINTGRGRGCFFPWILWVRIFMAEIIPLLFEGKTSV